MFGKPVHRPVELPEDRVELKTILGIQPAVWLAALYATVFAAALSAFLVLPGILRPGSLVAFDSEPRGAAVYVDSVYSGATPFALFVAAGEREIKFSAPAFDSSSSRQTVGSRLIASAVLPKRISVFATLEAEDPVLALAWGAREFARWSFAGEPSATYQIPLVLSEAAYRAGPSAATNEDRLRMEEVLAASARFAATAPAMRDLSRALSLVENSGLAASPLSILSSARSALAYLDEAEGSAIWLASVLGADAKSQIASSAFYSAQNDRASAVSRSAATATKDTSPRRMTVGPLAFREIPAGILVPRGSLPRSMELSSFWIAEGEVSEAAWNAFTAADKRWSAEGTAALVAKGLATDRYLSRSAEPAFPAQSASGVSWYAAQAYCDWLQASLPASLSAARVRLPTEAEWERASAFPLSGMTGSLWEWCDDPFAPVDFLPAGAKAVAAVSSPERALRGGSWANAASPVAPGTRASLPPESCSEFVGFRPVIVIGEGKGP